MQIKDVQTWLDGIWCRLLPAVDLVPLSKMPRVLGSTHRDRCQRWAKADTSWRSRDGRIGKREESSMKWIPPRLAQRKLDSVNRVWRNRRGGWARVQESRGNEKWWKDGRGGWSMKRWKGRLVHVTLIWFANQYLLKLGSYLSEAGRQTIARTNRKFF